MESNSPFIVVQLSARKYVVAQRDREVYKPITKATPRLSEAIAWKDHIEVTDVRFYDPAIRAAMLD